MDITSGLGHPRKTRGKPQNRIRRLAGLIHRFPRSHLANTSGTTCRNPREKRDSRWDRRSADILAISSSEQRFRYIPLQRIPGIPGVNEAVPLPICYVTTPAWASRLAMRLEPGPSEAGSGSGLPIRPSSASAGLPVPGRRRVTWRPSVGRTAGSGDHCREHLRDREESLGKPGKSLGLTTVR